MSLSGPKPAYSSKCAAGPLQRPCSYDRASNAVGHQGIGARYERLCEEGRCARLAIRLEQPKRGWLFAMELWVALSQEGTR